LLTNLAIAFHRIYIVPIKQSGNDLIDINNIAEKLNIQITIHAINRDNIHSTTDKNIKIYILLDKKSLWFRCEYFRVQRSWKKMYCNACNSSPECKRALTNTNVCSQCNKLFYNESCFNNHLVNNWCTEYSYRCDTCKKVINSKERPMMEHICGEVHCQNCKRYVLNPHECFMQRFVCLFVA